MVRGGDGVKSKRVLGGGRGYRYISQLGETFYRGVRAYLTISRILFPFERHIRLGAQPRIIKTKRKYFENH